LIIADSHAIDVLRWIDISPLILTLLPPFTTLAIIRYIDASHCVFAIDDIDIIFITPIDITEIFHYCRFFHFHCH
jgi:hypothetical protein